MKPCEIRDLLSQASTAREGSPAGIHTFALYWIAWEAYRTRMLAVAMRLSGSSIKDAYFAIGAKKISTQRRYTECFQAITGIDLIQQKRGIGKAWTNLNALESLRHRLVHGYRGADPILMRDAITFLDCVLTNHERIFGRLTVVPGKQPIHLGNPLLQRPAAGHRIAICKERQDLIKLLQLKTAVPGKAPGSEVQKSLRRFVEEIAFYDYSMHETQECTKTVTQAPLEQDK
jgi:hypothetical protein